MAEPGAHIDFTQDRETIFDGKSSPRMEDSWSERRPLGAVASAHLSVSLGIRRKAVSALLWCGAKNTAHRKTRTTQRGVLRSNVAAMSDVKLIVIADGQRMSIRTSGSLGDRDHLEIGITWRSGSRGD